MSKNDRKVGKKNTYSNSGDCLDQRIESTQYCGVGGSNKIGGACYHATNQRNVSVRCCEATISVECIIGVGI
jgi:hypothetical protein